MDKGEKRSFYQMEGSSVDEYVFSTSDHQTLSKLVFESSSFKDNLDINSKIATLKISPSVVSLISFSGEVVMSQCSGTIIECEANNNIVITSLNLIRDPTKTEHAGKTLAKNLKIIVNSPDKSSYAAEIVNYDFHYNILIIKFKSKNTLQSAKLGVIDDDVGLDRDFRLRPHLSKVKPGDPVIAVGRYFYWSFDVMANSGCFSMDRRDPELYDCRELLTASCSITRCGDGGPLINLSGEVIGIAYYEPGGTCPFLPINIAYKWRDYRESRHPSYGFEGISMYLGRLPTLESVIRNIPSISNGVMVEEVQLGSNAESAGLREDDIITKCDGKSVKSFLELWNLMWEKTGHVVELEVARVDHSTVFNISLTVGEAMPDKLNKWPHICSRR